MAKRKRRWSVVPQDVIDRCKALYETHGRLETVSEIVGIHPSQLSAIKKRGWREAVIQEKRPMPDDFPFMAHRLKASDLVEHYRCSYRVLARWRSKLSIPVKSRRGEAWIGLDRKRPIPADFAERDQEMWMHELAAHYGASPNTVRRWRSEIPSPRRAYEKRKSSNANT